MTSEIVVRQEQHSDRAAVLKVHELAFGRLDEGKLVERIWDSDTYIPELGLVATVDNRVVGHVLFSKITIDNGECDGRTVLALAPLAVHPDYQKKGVGSALSRQGIEKARELGWNGIIVLGQATYYPRFGFEPASEFGIESPFPLRDPGAFMAMELQPDGLTNCSGTAIYPKFFSDID
jgi:putative acetyltransferase